MLSKKSVLVTSMIVVSTLAACAAPADSQDAPEVEAAEAIDTQDQGTTYNGWTQAASGTFNSFIGAMSYAHTLTRASGDATRGGGACLVRTTAPSCSSDATCLTAAQSQFGSTAWGYCYSGKCYSRPGSQANLCVLNPNRSPGTLNGIAPGSYYAGQMNILGCMTKTAGPNTACGGTDTSLYMRTVTAMWLE